LRQLPGNKKEEITTDGARASDLVIAVSRKANDTVLLQAVHQGRPSQIVDDGEHEDFCLCVLEAGVCAHNQTILTPGKQSGTPWDFGVPRNS
jgi:hypothetical protein